MIKLMMILSFFGMSLYAYGEHGGGATHNPPQNGGRPYDGAKVDAEVENTPETNDDLTRIVDGLDKKNQEHACSRYIAYEGDGQYERCMQPKTGEISKL